jgi:hypothetical protein
MTAGHPDVAAVVEEKARRAGCSLLSRNARAPASNELRGLWACRNLVLGRPVLGRMQWALCSAAVSQSVVWAERSVAADLDSARGEGAADQAVADESRQQGTQELSRA